MFKPIYTLLYLLLVGLVLATISLVFPKDGIQLSTDFSLHFANIHDFLEKDSVPTLNVEELLESYEEPFDSTSFRDSVKTFNWNERQKKLRIHYAAGVTQKLPHFFNQLYHFRKGKDKIRIVHYGDSQIEGDRISSFLRNEFQEVYGGNGPGYVPAKMVVPSMSISQSQSENWERYTVFGRRDTTVKHNKYGMYGIFSRFTSYLDSVQTDTVEAWINLSPSYLGYSETRRYSRMELMYGNVTKPFGLKVFSDEVLILDTIIKSQGNAQHLELRLSKTPKDLKLVFKGVASPDVYGVRLESSTGVAVDNVAMRGSSGTIFKKMSKAQLTTQYKQSPAQLIILQYGGNTVPYIKSKKEADRYGDWFKGQILYLKSIIPDADIVVIGPSDMATKVKTNYETYPYLEEVRNALKKATLESGCGFWDIYEVMGGKNSMASWVNTNPPLAGKDYVHFTPRGAKRIAELFYEALDKDYQAFVKAEEEKQQKLQLEAELKKQQELDSLKTDSVVYES